ncbi:MAG: MerR family transcriptional regulator [Lachnospiraceae bacterium]|nr:MerR family transcriptional regulator [Lachnospiraceae bacterium]
MEEKTIFYISEAAKKVQVESHVLRYWEDELKLPIKRNEMGHRYYTEQDIKQLQHIKLLKEQGLQLKAIRTVLFKIPPVSGGEQNGQSVSESQEGAGKSNEKITGDTNCAVWQSKAEIREEKLMNMVKESVKENTEGKNTEQEHRYAVVLPGKEGSAVSQQHENNDAERERKAARLQYLLQHMITEAVKSANKELCTDVKDSILKELDYQFRMQEERDEARWKQEEEHYRKIDEMIRDRHKTRERLGKGKKKV